MAAMKKVRTEDVFEIYKNSYSVKIPWKNVFSEEIENWLTVFEKATNCSKTLITASLLSLVAALTGPESKVTVGSSEYTTVLNQFIISVCAPGGGKSNTFYRVVDPVIEKIRKKHGVNLQLETYTTAGLQKHQIDNNGYGLITSDEEHRFLTSINVKQSKGEGERSLLCKMWGGKGDTATLVSGNRGFLKTSMSICLFIQPHPLLSELFHLGGDDGLLDRFLFFVSKPIFNTSAVTKENMQILKDSNVQDFAEILTKVYEEHTKGQLYTLSEVAEQEFDAMTDSYAEFISRKYGSDEEDDKENNEPSMSQNDPSEESSTITSKDTTHILRLAVALHILQHNLTGAMENRLTPTPTEITEETLKQAMVLYNAVSQQKAIFVQSVQAFEKEVSNLRIKSVMSFRERVFKAVCKAKSPCVSIRYLQQHLKGSLSQNIRIELEHLERLGFGKLKALKTRQGKKDFFMKIHPNCIDEEIGEHQKMLTTAAISIENYRTNFNDDSTIGADVKAFLMQNHPQSEMIEFLW